MQAIIHNQPIKFHANIIKIFIIECENNLCIEKFWHIPRQKKKMCKNCGKILCRYCCSENDCIICTKLPKRNHIYCYCGTYWIFCERCKKYIELCQTCQTCEYLSYYINGKLYGIFVCKECKFE